MQHQYPNANYYAEQPWVQGRHHVLYMAPIPNRIPSESSTNGLVRTFSSEEIQSMDTVDSVATVASIPGNNQADVWLSMFPMLTGFLIDKGDTIGHANKDVQYLLNLSTHKGDIFLPGWRYLTYQK